MPNLDKHLSETYHVASTAYVGNMLTVNLVYKDANSQTRVAGTGVLIAGQNQFESGATINTYKYQSKHGYRSYLVGTPTPA